MDEAKVFEDFSQGRNQEFPGEGGAQDLSRKVCRFRPLVGSGLVLVGGPGAEAPENWEVLTFSLSLGVA